MLSNPLCAKLALWDYRHDNCIVLDMFGDSNRIKAMRERADKFWHSVQIGKAPEPQKGDYVEIEDEKLHELLLEYQSIAKREKSLAEERKEVKAKIEKIGDGRNFISRGFKVHWVIASTRYDVDQMKADGIDIGKYVKKGSRHSRNRSDNRICFLLISALQIPN